MANNDIIAMDKRHAWHPYASVTDPLPVYEAQSASDVRIRLADGTELIDGMASWWCAVHGYNHPDLNRAATEQLGAMSHVMFGGMTHSPAAGLCARLAELTPGDLNRVFLCDSGSVSVEVAMKMAMQYMAARGDPDRCRFLTVRRGYHGDTFHAMSVCDPVNGMHSLFSGSLPRQFFAPEPGIAYDGEWDDTDIAELAETLRANRDEICAVILEPVVQGAGGMRFYHPTYLRRLRELCDEQGVLLIFDEIATGFGRSGEFWGADHAGVAPDIMCVGKAITGGYMTLGATIATDHVAETICSADPGLFMHGPTFMGNPLACAVANAALDLLEQDPWRPRVKALEEQMRQEFAPCAELDHVTDVRVLGAIGVVELDRPVVMAEIQKQFVERGVWVRPFGRLVYVMPPYVMQPDDLSRLTAAIREVVERDDDIRQDAP
ncbi:adenosylmethionine--8-amino-7-oxononanoate transaminase [Desulfovibrio oxyclinae]|uniref:adenosylmethionine--8-amino-7-oxononanoate transaminase n=1 Tax=Desulfovibrio oxyclinae TaxID=63560 RepID=UPI000477F368|nr:adenosylmethionine--8-amino-7-oxononanoate transaminase [Desulfovibrio oxyclinae]